VVHLGGLQLNSLGVGEEEKERSGEVRRGGGELGARVRQEEGGIVMGMKVEAVSMTCQQLCLKRAANSLDTEHHTLFVMQQSGPSAIPVLPPYTIERQIYKPTHAPALCPLVCLPVSPL
jgi:hypothetical protein